MITKRKPQTLNKLRDKVQAEFNKYIRARDSDKGCISCGGPVEQAGHFYSAGQFTALRFNEDNCHGQCLQDNYFKHGHLINYKTNLLRRIGQQRMDMLESTATRNRVKRWSRFELLEILKIYQQKNKDFE